MTQRVLSVAGVGGLGIVMLVLGAQIGHAQVSSFPTSDRPAGYVVFPKVVVDLDDVFEQGRKQDTVIQLTNTGHETRVVECFYVDATNRCNNALTGDTGFGRYCRTTEDCRPGGQCLPQWSQTDFTIVLTPDQPVGWRASETTDLSEIDGAGIVKPAGDYFIGELKCFEVDGETIVDTTTSPIRANDLKGEASIYDVTAANVEVPLPGSVDVREYNAVGFQAQSTLDSDQYLCLGSSPGSANCAEADYAACPSILVVNHFFDGATDEAVEAGVISSDLTLVPCSEDLTEAPGSNGVSNQKATTAQILVFNEFEQRLSTSVTVDCFKETQLSLIDQSAGNQRNSVFAVGIQGTQTGQTRIRPVLTADPNSGNGLLAVVEEFHCTDPDPATGSCAATGDSVHHSAAFNVDYIGINSAKGDVVRYSVAP
jgi:hypothetical protein